MENKYYAHVFENVLQGSGMCRIITDGWQSIEITKEIYDSIDHYMYSNGQIIEDPDYEEKQEQKRKDQRNLEIDQKIKELNEMAITDLLQGNKANIDLYNEVIVGLEQARPE